MIGTKQDSKSPLVVLQVLQQCFTMLHTPEDMPNALMALYLARMCLDYNTGVSNQNKMIILKYHPRISRKEKAKIIAHDHIQTLPEYNAETRALIFARMTAHNTELNRMYGMHIEMRN